MSRVGFPYMGRTPLQTDGVAMSMQKKLGQFLHKKRGNLSYPALPAKWGFRRHRFIGWRWESKM